MGASQLYQSKVWTGSTRTESSRTKEQSQVRSVEAAEIDKASQEPPTKRQKIAFSVADMEQQMQAELDQLRSQKRHKELQLQIEREKQQMFELDQQQEDLRTRKMMSSSAQGSCALTEQAMSALTSNQDVQFSNTPLTSEPQHQAVLAGSSAAENSKMPAAQPDQMRREPKNPDFFQSQTFDGRYKQWVGGGQYAGIKSQLVMNKMGWGCPERKAFAMPRAQSTISGRRGACLKRASSWWCRG